MQNYLEDIFEFEYLSPLDDEFDIDTDEDFDVFIDGYIEV